jgi:hypothetical protein
LHGGNANKSDKIKMLFQLVWHLGSLLHLASDEAAARIALGPLCSFAAPARCIHLHMMQLRAIARSIFASYPLEHGKLIRADYFGACQLAP